MSPVALQRLAALAALPFYVFLLPFGGLVHLGFIFLAFRHGLVTRPAESWPGDFGPLWKVALAFYFLWLFLPPIVGGVMLLMPEDAAIAMGRATIAASQLSIFPSSIPEYATVFEHFLGPMHAGRYAVMVYVLALYPVVGCLIFPRMAPALLVRGFSRIQHPLLYRKQLPRLGAGRAIFGILLFSVGVWGLYSADYSVSHDAGIVFETSEMYTSAPVGIFPMHWAGFVLTSSLICIVLAHFCAKRIPLPEEILVHIRTEVEVHDL